MIITNIQSLGKRGRLYWYNLTIERNGMASERVYGFDRTYGYVFNEAGRRLEELSFEAASVRHAIHIHELKV